MDDIFRHCRPGSKFRRAPERTPSEEIRRCRLSGRRCDRGGKERTGGWCKTVIFMVMHVRDHRRDLLWKLALHICNLLRVTEAKPCGNYDDKFRLYKHVRTYERRRKFHPRSMSGRRSISFEGPSPDVRRASYIFKFPGIRSMYARRQILYFFFFPVPKTLIKM